MPLSGVGYNGPVSLLRRVAGGQYLCAVVIGGLDAATPDVDGVGDVQYRVLLWPAGS